MTLFQPVRLSQLSPPLKALSSKFSGLMSRISSCAPVHAQTQRTCEPLVSQLQTHSQPNCPRFIGAIFKPSNYPSQTYHYPAIPKVSSVYACTPSARHCQGKVIVGPLPPTHPSETDTCIYQSNHSNCNSGKLFIRSILLKKFFYPEPKYWLMYSVTIERMLHAKHWIFASVNGNAIHPQNRCSPKSGSHAGFLLPSQHISNPFARLQSTSTLYVRFSYFSLSTTRVQVTAISYIYWDKPPCCFHFCSPIIYFTHRGQSNLMLQHNLQCLICPAPCLPFPFHLISVSHKPLDTIDFFTLKNVLPQIFCTFCFLFLE